MINTKWKKHDFQGRDVYERSGINARNNNSSNAHKVEVHRHYNGSGPEAFGGADEWPAVSAQVSFEEGQEERSRQFAKALMNFIDTYLEVNK